MLTCRQGVVLSVTSLIMALAQDHLDAFAVCYQKAVDRLNRVSTFFIYWELNPEIFSSTARCGARVRRDIRLLQGTNTLAAGQASTPVAVLPAFR